MQSRVTCCKHCGDKCALRKHQPRLLAEMYGPRYSRSKSAVLRNGTSACAVPDEFPGFTKLLAAPVDQYAQCVLLQMTWFAAMCLQQLECWCEVIRYQGVANIIHDKFTSLCCADSGFTGCLNILPLSYSAALSDHLCQPAMQTQMAMLKNRLKTFQKAFSQKPAASIDRQRAAG